MGGHRRVRCTPISRKRALATARARKAEKASLSLAAEVTTCAKTLVVGRRVITIGAWLDSLRFAGSHGQQCESPDFYFAKEVKSGLRSRMLLQCHTCCWDGEWVCNDKDEPEVTLPVNEALVWGTNAGGSHYQAVKELMTILDIPFPTHKLYSSMEKKVSEEWSAALSKEIVENGKAEAEAALSAGRTCFLNGLEYPCTSVYADGSWSTRSYGHSCKSKGGVAVIIGSLTKKLLFIGVRNMFCLMCKRAANLNIEPPEHTCYKNWDENRGATSMETDILLEGFKLSLEMHGLVYWMLIADGDSSVYATLLNANIYPGITIQKAECVNHVLKNLNKAIIQLVADSSLPLDQRKLLKPHLHRFGKSVRAAIAHRFQSDGGNHILLRTDIMNVPFHTFGQHDKCAAYFCSKPDELNQVVAMKGNVVWNKLVDILNNVAFKSSRLISNVTTNIAESLMNRLAKHNHGKRLNTIQKGGWHGKCIAAGLPFSKGSSFYSSIFSSMRGQDPSRRWKKANENSESKIRRVKLYDAIMKKKPKSTFVRKAVSDKHYGPNAAGPDMDDDVLLALINTLKLDKQVTQQQRDEIFLGTLDQAASDRWMEERHHRVTASIAGEVFALKDTTSNVCLVKKILYPKSLDHLSAIRHGNTNERMGMLAYSRETGNFVEPSGLVVFLENGILAATPDGLVGEDGLVEVKCPEKLKGFPPESMPSLMASSYLKPKSKTDPTLELNPKDKYYRQVITQLYVTGRRWCDFVVYTYRMNSGVQEDYKPFIQRIERNEVTDKLWDEMREKMIKFYTEDLAPEIVNPRFTRNMPIRQPTYRQEARREFAARKAKKAERKAEKASRNEISIQLPTDEN